MVASSTGGLLTAGTWSTQTLATYTLSGSASSFTMSTSKGNCAVQSGQLTCGSGVSSASSFSAVSWTQLSDLNELFESKSDDMGCCCV